MIELLARRACGLAVAAAFMLFAAVAGASAQSGPFAGMSGSWTGGGHISLENGTRERIRCRATYNVVNNGHGLQQSLRCASDSYNFELRSDVESRGGRVSGNWTESTRNIGGSLSGRARQGHVEVSVENPSFNARLTLVSNGKRQSVTIRSSSGQFKGASITLAKRG